MNNTEYYNFTFLNFINRTFSHSESSDTQPLPIATTTIQRLPPLKGPSYSTVFDLTKENLADEWLNSFYLPSAPR